MNEADQINETAGAYVALMEMGYAEGHIGRTDLQRILASGSIFDLPTSAQAERAEMLAAFSTLNELVAALSLSPAGIDTLNSRVKTMLATVDEGWKRHEFGECVRNTRCSNFLDEHLIDQYLAGLAAMSDEQLMCGLAVIARDTTKFIAEKVAGEDGEAHR